MKPDKPIVTSLLQNDFYKFSMWYFIYKHFRNVRATFGLTNRTIDVPLGKYLDISEVREQLDHARTLRFSKEELDSIAETSQYGESMFPVEFIDFIKDYGLPEYLLERNGDNLRIEFPGLWMDTTQWEIFSLMIVNTMLNRVRIANLSHAEKASFFNEGDRRLMAKVDRIKRYKYANQFTFSDFGTRRCFSPEWQDRVVEVFKTHIPDQLKGTSNCYLARKYGLMAVGTRAHEPEIVMAALAGLDNNKLKQVPFEFCRLWSPGTYGKGLQAHLPDTFGSDYFFKNAPPELATWSSVRQDSGDPYIIGMKAVRWYERHDQDLNTKTLIPSDGLNVDLMLKLHAHFINLVKVSPGLGTNGTNDFPNIKPVSIVVKPIEVEGRPAVKLSDNIAKAMGDPAEVKRYEQVFDNQNSFNKACVY